MTKRPIWQRLWFILTVGAVVIFLVGAISYEGNALGWFGPGQSDNTGSGSLLQGSATDITDAVTQMNACPSNQATDGGATCVLLCCVSGLLPGEYPASAQAGLQQFQADATALADCLRAIGGFPADPVLSCNADLETASASGTALAELMGASP